MAITRTGKAKELFEKEVKLPFEEHEKRIAGFSEVIKLLPDDDESYHNRSFHYLSIGQLDEALADINKAISLNPVYTHYSCRWDIYFQLGDVEKATADLQNALKLAPEKAAVSYYSFAESLRGVIFDDDQAAVYYKKAIETGNDYWSKEAQKALDKLGK